MKFVIASDIHGSAYYCEKLINCFEKEKADRLILLGDILYHGPRNDLPRDYSPKEVIEILNFIKQKIISVRGNCDTEVDQMVLDFPILADYGVIPIKNNIMYLSHGHIYNPTNLPPLCKGDILINGHTHVPKLTIYDNFVYINPGSVSIPKENSVNSYMVFESSEFLWKNINNSEIYKSYELKDD